MDKNKTAQEPLVANLKVSQNSGNMNSIFTKKIFIFLIAAAILGGITGYALRSGGETTGGNALNSGNIDSSKLTKGTTVGSNDTKTFKDATTGTLENGGIDGEGQFHLIRPGGASQNVYLTSSIIDLSKFVNKKVKVWGQTQTAQYAGWLMDVGRIEVLE